jgi:hypothetical protein
LDIFTLALNDREKTAQPLISTSALDVDGELSPDGRWLAYHSSESGELQVYVRPYPNVQDGRYQISTTGGTRPAWARSGRELFYLDRDGLLTSVTVADAQGTAFSAGTPARILRTRYYAGSTLLGLDLRAYDIAPDGQRFLMIKEGESTQPREAPLPGMVVVLNWGTELIARLPAR